LVYPKYLLFIINSEIARIQFFSRLIGIGVPNLHLGEIKEVVIPLPPLSKQIEVSRHIEEIRAEISDLAQQIKTLNLNAQQEFENSIFN
jgi:type I restriction enzyme S subunit